jgi:hypothetical protein
MDEWLSGIWYEPITTSKTHDAHMPSLETWDFVYVSPNK